MKPTTPEVSFEVLAKAGHARLGKLRLPHAEVDTPTFMPVGTQGSVKTLTPEEVAATGAQIVLGNTYHLWLRPSAELIASAGGLHRFARWPHAMLTDSGGFQAFSLSERRRVSEDGFVFRSHLDGAKKALSPEEAMRVQGLIGADIAMQLDVCPPGTAERKDFEAACARTTRWAKRCLESKRRDQALFGIVQGGCHVDLRRAHMAELGELPLDGLALGGFSVGEPIEKMHEVVGEIARELDEDRPRYLMGVGTPRDLVLGIAAGIDMFDCVLPTRNARNGQILLKDGRIVIKQARYKEDFSPLDPNCPCPACLLGNGYSRAYLRHLFIAKEILALRLFSAHNLHLYGALTRDARAAIATGELGSFLRAWANAGMDDEKRVT